MPVSAVCTLALVVDGSTLPEHSFADAGQFVVVQPGAEFSLRMRSLDRHITVELFVDGQRTGHKRHMRPNSEYTALGWREPAGERQFVFSRPITSEGQQLPGQRLNQQTGECRLVVWPCTYTGGLRKSRSSPFSRASYVPARATVPESKKALALGVAAGAGLLMPRTSPHQSSAWRSDKSAGPLVELKLRYCIPHALALSTDPMLKRVGQQLEQLGSVVAPSSGGRCKRERGGQTHENCPRKQAKVEVIDLDSWTGNPMPAVVDLTSD